MNHRDEMRRLINLVEGANRSKLNEDANLTWPEIESILVHNKLRFDPKKPNPLISKPQKEIEAYFKAFSDDQIAEIYQALEREVANYKEKVSQMTKSLPNLDRIHTPEEKEKVLRILDLNKRAFEHYAKLEVAVQNVAANRGVAGQGPGDPITWARPR